MTQPEDIRPILFAPGYEIADDGRVFSTKSGQRRELAGWKEKNGYCRVSLCVDGKRRKFWLQNLLCRVFHGAPPTARHEARHLDGDPSHNTTANLAWGTHAENMRDMVRHGRSGRQPLVPKRPMDPAKRPHGSRVGGAKLTEHTVAEIRRRIEAGETVVDLAAEYGVNKYTLYHMKWGQTWSHV